MKQFLLPVLLFLIVTSSCRVAHLPYTSTVSEPYVQLKNGQKFEGNSAERSTGILVRDKIQLGDTSFKSRDVAFYSTGTSVFANVGHRYFATQVAAGKVNLYRYSSTYSTTSSGNGYGGGGYGGGGMTTTTHHSVSYYIQKEPGSPIKHLTYRNLATMENIKTPEYKMLQSYKKTRTVARALGYGAIGLIAGGLVMANSNNTKVSNAAAGVAGVGVLALMGWVGVYTANYGKLVKSVLIADKGEKAGTHKRVK